MASRGANGCLKLFLIAVNFVFLLFGIAILGFGIYLCTNAQLGQYSEILAGMEILRSVRLILIGCGCVILLIGLCGCVGACKEMQCPLIAYVILLLLILIANVAAIALSIVYTNELKSYASEQMKDSLKRYYGNTTDPSGKTFTETIDNIQQKESCCGWTGLGGGAPNFFTSTPWYRLANANATAGSKQQTFPASCCAVGGEKLDRCIRATNETDARDFGYIHRDDCWDRLMSLSSRFVHATIGTVATAIVLQIVCLICSVVLLRQIANSAGTRGGVFV